jgi:hypothetical protein
MIEQITVPPTPALPDMRLVVRPIDPLVLESIFLTPGRNDPCYCGSGDKYKRCCQPLDQEAWRVVMQKTRQADAVCAMLPASIMKMFNQDEV